MKTTSVLSFSCVGVQNADAATELWGKIWIPSWGPSDWPLGRFSTEPAARHAPALTSTTHAMYVALNAFFVTPYHYPKQSAQRQSEVDHISSRSLPPSPRRVALLGWLAFSAIAEVAAIRPPTKGSENPQGAFQCADNIHEEGHSSLLNPDFHCPNLSRRWEAIKG